MIPRSIVHLRGERFTSTELGVAGDHPVAPISEVVQLPSSLPLDSEKRIKTYVGESLAMNMGVQMHFLTDGTIGI